MNRALSTSRGPHLRERLGHALHGALDGMLATVPMTVVMVAAQRLGLMGTLPPKIITEAAIEAAHATPGEDATNILAGINHIAFGAGVGALYGVAAPRSTGARGALPGIVVGLGVWLASYQGWVPGAGIMPPASRDRPGRAGTMLVAHIVFGGLLGLLTARRHRVVEGRAPAGHRGQEPHCAARR